MKAVQTKAADLHLLCDQTVKKCRDLKHVPVLCVRSRKQPFLHLQTDAPHLQSKCCASIKTNWKKKKKNVRRRTVIKCVCTGEAWEECERNVWIF